MNRRPFLHALLLASISALGAAWATGRGFMGKRNIKHFGKSFEYLKNPELRTRETNDALLVIRDAEISGTLFSNLQWRNIHFINCDISGAYEIKLDTMENCKFENCYIVGIHNFGDLNHVHFLRCKSFGHSNWIGDINSKNVVFEACEFDGQNPDSNYWLAVGSYGEAEFIRCKAKYTDFTGDRGLSLRECECEDTVASPFIGSSRKGDEPFAALLIENCKFKGNFKVRPAQLQSFTLRDTRFEKIDLTGADIRGDVTIERVYGGVIDVTIKEGARNLIVRDSKFSDPEQDSGFYAGAFKSVLVENCSFSIGVVTKPAVGIGGGYEPDDPAPQPVMTESVTLRNIQTRFIRSGRLNAGLLRIEGCEFDIADLRQSKLDRIEIKTTTIHHRLDLSRTQAKEQNIQLSKPSGISPRLDVLDGSNIRMPY